MRRSFQVARCDSEKAVRTGDVPRHRLAHPGVELGPGGLNGGLLGERVDMGQMQDYIGL